METLLWAYRGLGSLLVVSVAVPFVPSDHWKIRVFDYPRSQKLFLVIVCMAMGALGMPFDHLVDNILLGLLVACACYLAWLVWPYTPFAKHMVTDGRPGPEEKPLRLLICNVLQSNTHHERLVTLVQQRDPDIVFLLETDIAWRNGLDKRLTSWAHRIEVPLDNTYGLLFYSRFPIERHEVSYLIDREVPSIVADIRYGGRTVRLHGLHPTPPVPHENPESTERDAEVLLVGREAHECALPVIVFGDLNDVAWSHTTRLFLRTSGLLDPRRGRGMFNTFHAGYPFLRWPLDHLFVSPHFRVVDMQVERGIGSDHFPISMSVVIRSEDEDAVLDATPSDHAEAAEKITSGKENGDVHP